MRLLSCVAMTLLTLGCGGSAAPLAELPQPSLRELPELRYLGYHGFPVISCIAFSADGKLLAVGSHHKPRGEWSEGEVILWDTATWKVRAALALADRVTELSGTITYDPAAPKPVRGAHVIIVADGFFPVGTTYTNDSGQYDIVLPNPSYKSLAVAVYSETKPPGTDTEKNVIRAVRVTKNTATTIAYQIRFPPKDPAPPGGYTGKVAADFTIGKTSDAEKAFWVYDAAVTAARMHARLPGIQAGRITIGFPGPVPNWIVKLAGLTSWTLNEQPHIIDDDFDNWDTIIHEYGHAVAQENGFFPFSLFGYIARTDPLDHTFEVNNRVRNAGYSFLANNKLAFSEGFADFFSMLAQEEEYTPARKVASIARSNSVSGDGKFDAATVESGKPIQEPIPPPPAPPTVRDSVERSDGEDEELSVMRVLWDLYDTPSAEDTVSIPPSGPDFAGRNMDRVALGFSNLFSLIKSNHVETLDQLWDALKADATGPGGLNQRKMLDYGAIFQLNNVSAQPFFIRQGGAIVSQLNINGLPPTFVWLAPEGWPGSPAYPALAQPMDAYSIVILNENYTVRFTSPLIPADRNRETQSWTPTANEWNNGGIRGVGTFHWYVYSSAIQGAYQTGPYWSDALDFTMK